MPKKNRKRKHSRRNTPLSRQHAAKTASLACPICNQRIPFLGIQKHYAEAHPDQHFDASKVKSISYIPSTNGKGSPGFGNRKGGWPMAGGLPSLGRKR